MNEDKTILAIIFAFFVIGVLLFTFLSRAACGQVGSTTGRPTTYRVLTGCYVKADAESGWVPLDSWRTGL